MALQGECAIRKCVRYVRCREFVIAQGLAGSMQKSKKWDGKEQRKHAASRYKTLRLMECSQLCVLVVRILIGSHECCLQGSMLFLPGPFD